MLPKYEFVHIRPFTMMDCYHGCIFAILIYILLELEGGTNWPFSDFFTNHTYFPYLWGAESEFCILFCWKSVLGSLGHLRWRHITLFGHKGVKTVKIQYSSDVLGLEGQKIAFRLVFGGRIEIWSHIFNIFNIWPPAVRYLPHFRPFTITLCYIFALSQKNISITKQKW